MISGGGLSNLKWKPGLCHRKTRHLRALKHASPLTSITIAHWLLPSDVAPSATCPVDVAAKLGASCAGLFGLADFGLPIFWEELVGGDIGRDEALQHGAVERGQEVDQQINFLWSCA